jgi:hypothetical protein
MWSAMFKLKQLFKIIGVLSVTLATAFPSASFAGKTKNYFKLSSKEVESQEVLHIKASPALQSIEFIEDYLVPKNIIDSTSDSHQVLRGRNRDGSKTETQALYNKIKADEAHIQAMHERLAADQYTSTDLYRSFGHLESDYLNEWEKRNAEFHQARIAVIAEKQTYLINILQQSLHHEIATRMTQLDTTSSSYRAEIAELEKTTLDLDARYERWNVAKEVIGVEAHPSKQNARMYAVTEYLDNAREIMITFGKADPWRIAKNPNKLKGFSGATGKMAAAFRILYKLFRRNYFSVSKKIGPNSTPLNTSVGGLQTFFNQMAKQQGYHLTVEGLENLQKLELNVSTDPTKKFVNLFLPAHRQSNVDAISMVNLGLPHFLLFANAAQSVPNHYLGKLMASLPEYISVGPEKGRFPISTADKAIQSVNQKISPNAINYPQGLIANIGEILPINPHFVEKLLLRFINEGYQVNLIPVAYETDSKALSSSGEIDDHNVTIRIMPPVMHDTLKVLIEKEMASQAVGAMGPKKLFINYFLNSVWYENIRKHKELTIDELLDRAEYNLQLKLLTQ